MFLFFFPPGTVVAIIFDLRVLPTIRAWMGGSLSWDTFSSLDRRVSKVYRPRPGVAYGLSAVELGFGGAATLPGVAGGASGCLSDLKIGALVSRIRRVNQESVTVEGETVLAR